jgi:uncharacterized membrane protein
MTQGTDNEIRMFQRSADALRAAMAAGDVATVREMIDEIEVISLHTDSDDVRQMCQPYMLPN